MFAIPAGVGVCFSLGSERKVLSHGGRFSQQLAWAGHGHSEMKQDQEVGLGQAPKATPFEKDHSGKKLQAALVCSRKP